MKVHASHFPDTVPVPVQPDTILTVPMTFNNLQFFQIALCKTHTEALWVTEGLRRLFF